MEPKRLTNWQTAVCFFQGLEKAKGASCNQLKRRAPGPGGTFDALSGSSPKGGFTMKMMNEALRMFLAVTALILTAMLTNPSAEAPTNKGSEMRPKLAKVVKAKSERKLASQSKALARR